MDTELRQLDLAIAEARRRATDALDALRGPQAALRVAAGDYIESVAARRVDASRRASVEVVARLSDDEVAELRFWTGERIGQARADVEGEIEACDFWIVEAPGMSPTDVADYANALMPRPKDSKSGIPQALVLLFEQCLVPLRRGLTAIGMAVIPAEAEPRAEVALVRAWRTYRDAAIECVARWADVDERYYASAARFQEMRWELAGQVDVEELKARLAAEDAEDAERSLIAEAETAAATAAEHGTLEPGEEPAGGEAFSRPDSETLLPVPGRPGAGTLPIGGG
jgi:hypothetical protein